MCVVHVLMIKLDHESWERFAARSNFLQAWLVWTGEMEIGLECSAVWTPSCRRRMFMRGKLHVMICVSDICCEDKAVAFANRAVVSR